MVEPFGWQVLNVDVVKKGGKGTLSIIIMVNGEAYQALSKILSALNFYRKYTRTLTFENLCQGFPARWDQETLCGLFGVHSEKYSL